MKYVFLISLTIISSGLFSQHEKKVESVITNVTVFLSKAQITREVKTRVEAGKTNVIITGLTSQLDQQSIQVAGKGSVIILGISHQQNYLNEFNTPKHLKTLKDSLEYYQRQVALENSNKEILVKEEQMLLSNQKIGGANENLSAAELKAMADFFRTRMTEIVNAKMRLELKIKKLNDRLRKIQQQIEEETALYANNTSEVVVSLSAETATTVELVLNYIVSNAGWYPVYDLRALNTKSPVQLSYKANVFQSTGEEWKNIRLKLSTANPNLTGQKPELYAWYLDFYQPVVYRSAVGGAPRKASAAMDSSGPEEIFAEDKVIPSPAETPADYVSTIQTSLNTEFDIALPYTVHPSNKPTLVDIRNHQLKADYVYSVAPKIDRDAFLVAKVTGWEELSLLPGTANIFFEGTFVSNSEINPNNIKDTLLLSLGRDKRIVVKREKLKDYSSKRFIGSNRTDSYAYEISVRNTKTEPISIVVEDQIPISRNNQIEVERVDLANAKLDEVTGKLTWEIKVDPNQTQKLVYKFNVKYPKDKTVPSLE